MWPDTRLLDLLGIEVPLIQAPMAGAVSPEMVIQGPIALTGAHPPSESTGKVAAKGLAVNPLLTV
jgi:NAD(P)H-dependent flavin oxidoreductase YrpB (nitropropane dioxygenase family)